MKHPQTWNELSEWMLTRFTRGAPLGGPYSLALIVATTLSIAVADYVADINVSLSVFYFAPILLAVAWLGQRAAAGVAVASIAFKIGGDFFETRGHALPLWNWWNGANTLLMLLFVVWVFGHVLALYRQMEERVARRTQELMRVHEHRRQLEHELLTVSSNERNRMGQELHDDICQHLVGTALAAQVLSQRLGRQDSPLGRDAQAIIGLIEEGVSKTRQLAKGLLLSEIEPGKLPERLNELADEACRSGVDCSFRQAGPILVADAMVAAQLYRIAQESIRNAVRHADATRVEVALVGDREAVTLTVEDDGRGMPAEVPDSGMGLPIMSRRAAYIGATLSLKPASGHGTRLTCSLRTVAA